MSILRILLVLSAMAGFTSVLGLIKPLPQFWLPTRKRAAIVFCTACVVMIIVLPELDTEPVEATAQTEINTTTDTRLEDKPEPIALDVNREVSTVKPELEPEPEPKSESITDLGLTVRDIFTWVGEMQADDFLDELEWEAEDYDMGRFISGETSDSTVLITVASLPVDGNDKSLALATEVLLMANFSTTDIQVTSKAVILIAGIGKLVIPEWEDPVGDLKSWVTRNQNELIFFRCGREVTFSKYSIVNALTISIKPWDGCDSLPAGRSCVDSFC